MKGTDSGISASELNPLNLNELDELDDLILSSTMTSSTSPTMTSSTSLTMTSSSSPTNTESINESGLGMTPSREKPTPTPISTPTQSKMIYGKPKSEISSRIDRILNSTVDELDKIEICAAPSVTKNLSRRASPTPSSPTPTQNAHTDHVTSDDQTISEQSESVNSPSDQTCPIAKPRKPLSPSTSPPTQIDFNKIEINQADIFDQLESTIVCESSNEQSAFACQTYNEKYSESDTLIITDQSELSIQSVDSEPDQSEALNESVAEVKTGSEPEVEDELPKLKFEQVPAPGSEADLQAVQAVEPLPEPEVEPLHEPEVEPLPEPEVEPEPEPEFEPEPEPEPEIEQVVSTPKYSPRATPKVSAEAQKPSTIPSPKNVSAPPKEEKLDIEQEEPQMVSLTDIAISLHSISAEIKYGCRLANCRQTSLINN